VTLPTTSVLLLEPPPADFQVAEAAIPMGINPTAHLGPYDFDASAGEMKCGNRDDQKGR